MLDTQSTHQSTHQSAQQSAHPHQHRRPRIRDSGSNDYSGYSAVPIKRHAPPQPQPPANANANANANLCTNAAGARQQPPRVSNAFADEECAAFLGAMAAPTLPPRPHAGNTRQHQQHQHQHQHGQAQETGHAAVPCTNKPGTRGAAQHAWLCEGEACATVVPTGTSGGGGGGGDTDTAGRARPWFKGRMDARECERHVAGCLPGDFIVRQSSSAGKGYVLVVNDHHTAVNYPIRPSQAQAGATRLGPDFVFAGSKFESLDLVVKYIRGNPLRSLTLQHGNGRRAQMVALRAAACTAPWFAGCMPRREGEALVKGAAHGDFIVRLSSSRDKFNLVVNDKGTVCTFTIKATAAGDGHNQQQPHRAGVQQLQQVSASVSFGGERHATLCDLVADMQMRCFKSVVSRKMSLRRSAMPCG